MQLHEFVEKETEKLQAFHIFRIELNAKDPKTFPLDLDEHHWVALYMSFLSKRSQL